MKNNKRKAAIGIGTLLCLIIGWYTAYIIFDTHVYFEVSSSIAPFPNDKEKYEIFGKGSIKRVVAISMIILWLTDTTTYQPIMMYIWRLKIYIPPKTR